MYIIVTAIFVKKSSYSNNRLSAISSVYHILKIIILVLFYFVYEYQINSR